MGAQTVKALAVFHVRSGLLGIILHVLTQQSGETEIMFICLSITVLKSDCIAVHGDLFLPVLVVALSGRGNKYCCLGVFALFIPKNKTDKWACFPTAKNSFACK